MDLFRSAGELDGHRGLEGALVLCCARVLEPFWQSFSLNLRPDIAVKTLSEVVSS